MKFSIGLWDKLDPQTKRLLTRVRRPLWFGTLQNTKPISAAWGKDRGTPVDRYYIEKFLQLYSMDIHGKVLEVGDRTYTRKFGKNVERSDVLDNNLANIQATILADLESGINVDTNELDCLVFTQVLQFIYNVQVCLQELHRILKPGGVLLLTVPCVSKIASDYGMDKDYWRFTAASCERLFSDVFGQNHVTVQSFGNVFSSVAFLTGAAYEELSKKQLNDYDPLFPLLVSVRAVKQ